jgi:hypothetical protein
MIKIQTQKHLYGLVGCLLQKICNMNSICEYFTGECKISHKETEEKITGKIVLKEKFSIFTVTETKSIAKSAQHTKGNPRDFLRSTLSVEATRGLRTKNSITTTITV